MVGVPRSKGCALCVKRRVKCDEARPSCASCVKYGAVCPGYEKGFKFVTARTHRATRRPAQARGDGVGIPGSSSGSGRFSEESAIKSLSGRGTSSLKDNSSPRELNSPDLQLVQHTARLIDDFSRGSSEVMGNAIMRWFLFLPSRLGDNELLDAAVRCFTAYHVGNQRKDQAIVNYGRSTYVQALSKLRKTLGVKGSNVEAETLCAAMVLCLYELFGSATGHDTWKQHARGISQLIQIRGAKSYQNSFDRAMLVGFRGVIISDALFSGKPCFLAEPEWQRVIAIPIDCNLSPDLHDLVEEFSSLLAQCPALIGEAYDTRKAVMCGMVDLNAISSLIGRTLDLRDRLHCWYDRFSLYVPPPAEMHSARNDLLFSIAFIYPDFTTATIFCGYWACCIIVAEILTACQYDSGCPTNTTELVTKICSSVEYNGQGILGPYRMGFSLGVAYEVSNASIRTWIRDRLGEMSRNYVAISPESFPDVSQQRFPD
ncbi:C6 zinc finger domain protein [Aulographum hederae CBS 113979]|uniref:C6 zinc finger domain protein n=1 Tax=Aulographum hederae CBS 113979 TaxID=1176131 RepID=A0A6G1H6Z8_9PEZI|nr:C6 zinc finger domain protein [Aulographum hederae CBS 113979]